MKRVAIALTYFLAALLLAPLLVIVAAAFAPSDALGISSEQWVAGAGAGRAFRYVLDVYGPHLATSFGVALAAGTTALVLGAPAGIALATTTSRTARALEALVTLPLAVPGLAVAIALIGAYPGGALGLLVVGHVLYTLPYTVRTIGAASTTMRLPSALEAARTLGADRIALVRLILWPALRRAFGAAALVALAVSWGEFNVSFLLATPTHATFPTALYLTYTTNSFPVAAAATTLFLAGLVPLLCVAYALGAAPEQSA